MAFGVVTYSGQANRGVDRYIQIRNDNDGSTINVGGRLASVEWSDKDTIEEVDGIDNGGRVDHQRYAGGGTLSFSVNRYNGDFEAFMKFIDANFYSGVPGTTATVTATTNNGFDMTTDSDTFTKCVFGKLKSGPFQNKSNAKVSFSAEYQERL